MVIMMVGVVVTSMNNQVLVDSDFWIGLYRQQDPHHHSCTQTLKQLVRQHKQPVTTNLVVGETMTVLSHKVSQDLAREFYKDIHSSNIPIYFVDESLDQTAKKLFISLDKKGTSYVDCTNVAVMRAYGFSQILAYDGVYHKKFDLNNLAYSEQTV